VLASVALHAVTAVIAMWLIVPARVAPTAPIDIEIAPPVPLPEALPPERAEPPRPDVDRRDEPEAEPDSAAQSAPDDSEGAAAIDAGVDAAPDARPDAAPDARPDAAPDAPPDAAPDAGVDAAPDDATITAGAELDAGTGDAGDDAGQIAATPDDAAQIAAAGDAGAGDAGDGAAQLAAASDAGASDAGVDAAQIAAVPDDAGGAAQAAAAAPAPAEAAGDAGPAAPPSLTAWLFPSGPSAGEGSGAAIDTSALAAALAAGTPATAGPPGTGDAPAVDGAPTTAGTAANLLAYFPDGQIVTALVRFDRLRGTEWAAPTERLLRPLPDYQLLFGARDADILGKLETLVISSPRPRDAAATTLVARTRLSRGALRSALGATSPVAWSVARGGLLGRRSNPQLPADQRVFLSPFHGWFLLAQPGDLGDLMAGARGPLDAAVATGGLPPWLAGIRAIEAESGDKRGPAVVVTIGLRGRRQRLGGLALAVGVRSIPMPDRISLAIEMVPQGWLLRGNMRFSSDADAAEHIASIQQIQRRIADSRALQLVLGKPIAHVIASLAFARNGARLSYAASASIADARAILDVAAQQIDAYFSGAGANLGGLQIAPPTAPPGAATPRAAPGAPAAPPAPPAAPAAPTAPSAGSATPSPGASSAPRPTAPAPGASSAPEPAASQPTAAPPPPPAPPAPPR
jgi:hypothetical protein